MNMRSSAPADVVADAMAGFVCDAPSTWSPDVARAARLALLDTFAVSLGALTHPAAQVARRYAGLFPDPRGALIWGTTQRAAPEVATLVNGVPLRGYDYNDLYIGERNGGHPSDTVPGLIAVAEWQGKSGRDFVNALVVGYEVALDLFDTVQCSKGGWDYVNLTGIAATCAVGRLMGLTRAQLVEALAIAVIPHAASNEIESGDLNGRGDLTMWKRFNGSDAVRNAVYACTLASVGVEGTVRPFVGKCGFLTKVNIAADAEPRLLERMARREPLRRILQTTFKRWSVGSRAQSAIQATLAARAQVGGAQIREVRVYTQSGVYDHLLGSRKDPWHPFSRETADHSLPYVVAAAVLDGGISPASFEPETVCDPQRQAFLNAAIKVEIAPELDAAKIGEYLSRVEIETVDGRVVKGDATPAPGHPKNPFSDDEMIQKLRDNVEPLLGRAGVDRLVAAVDGLERAPDLGTLVACLAIENQT